MHENTIALFRRHAAKFFQPTDEVLEVGPEGVPSRIKQSALFFSQWEYADISPTHPEVRQLAGEYDFKALPEYDIIISANVIEHVRQPWLWMCCLADQCRVGGVVITIVPVSWTYHECPVDCWRIYPEGMKALMEFAGLDVVVCECEALAHEPESTAAVYDTIGVGRKA